MDNKLAYQIISLIKQGTTGLSDIKIVLKNQHFNLKDEKIVEIISELKDTECIQPISTGHPKTYQLNPNKDCLAAYQSLVESEINSSNEDAETKDLQKRKLRIDVALGEKVLKTYRFTRVAAIFSFISAIVLLILKLLEALDILP